MKIDEAIKVAEAATPGPWRPDHGFVFSRDPYKAGLMPVAEMRGWGYLTGQSRFACGMEADAAIAIQNANAAHIAKFNPVTVLALLKFVQAFDTWQTSDEPAKVGQPFYNRLRKYRAAVDEALR